MEKIEIVMFEETSEKNGELTDFFPAEQKIKQFIWF